VVAGQHVAYCGDSGNAEDTISHLHFELSVPGKGTINAAASLRAAVKLKSPRYPLQPADAPPKGELRLDGQVVEADTARGVALIRVAAWANASGKVTPQTRPLRRWVRLHETADLSARTALGETAPGDFVTLKGRDEGNGKAIEANTFLLLRRNERETSSRRAAIATGARFSGTATSEPGAVTTPLPSSVQLKVVALTNANRAKYGIGPLTPDALLMRAAQAHAEDMERNGYFDHTDQKGGNPSDRTRAVGYPRAAIAENIAMGQRDAAEVMNSWMQSPGHRANLLNRDYRAIGVGVVGVHWVQVFGSVVAREATGEKGSALSLPGVLPSLPAPIILADFETGDYDGWERSGDCWGRGPEGAAFAGTALRGWGGRRFATTAHTRPRGGAPTGTGYARSAPFVIPPDAATIRFKIAGGRYPSGCCLNLLVDGKTVRTETGGSPYAFQSGEWNVADLAGKTARLEIVDTVAAGSHAYIHVDDITLTRLPPPAPSKQKAPPPSPRPQRGG